MINTIILGHALNVLPQLPAESVNCIATSPPYWGLRDYGIEPVIWDGDKNCKHKWIKGETAGDIRFRGKNSIVGNNRNLNIYPIKHRPNETNPGKEGWYKDKGGLSKNPSQSNFCSLCGAWRGSLGLELTFELYIKHLCDIFDEVKRVLRKDGTCWVNMGDSYWGGGQGGADYGGKEIVPESNFGHVAKGKNYLSKSLCDIPYRFSIEMINRGWIKRNTIIWHKPNCMPASADDRFTVDFEYLFFFTKNNKAIFWTNEKTLECVDKKPLGIKGIEGRDWEWRETQNWKGEENAGYKMGATDPHRAASIGGLKLGAKHKKSGKLKKVSLWSGHDYWFEQQFEEYAPDTLPRMDRGVNVNKWTLGADGQTPHNLSQPRLNKKRGYKTKQNDPKQIHPKCHGKDINYGKQGRNKRCVWKIPTKSFKEAHFAVYPETLIEPIIKAGCPKYVCKKCGKARVKIYGTNHHPTRPYEESKYINSNESQEKQTGLRERWETNRKELGHTDCGCNAGFEGGVVLDPFMGAGTTALVALKQRKRFIGIEIKQEYIDMAKRRIAKVQQRIF